MINKPYFKFYCLKCNIFFDLKSGINIDKVKCPNCKNYDIFIELEFENKIPDYYT